MSSGSGTGTVLSLGHGVRRTTPTSLGLQLDLAVVFLVAGLGMGASLLASAQARLTPGAQRDTRTSHKHHGGVMRAAHHAGMDDLTHAFILRHARPEAHHHAPAPTPTAPNAPLQVSWARHLDDLRAAQRLRHQVFAQEMGATLNTPLPGHDIDAFDDYCEHLLVRDPATQRVVGTYRVLTPAQARRAGGWYSDREFDLRPVARLRPHAVEMGRSCVHADWRSGAVILALWGELAAFLSRNRLTVMLGCASMPMHWPGVPRHGAAAAAVWHQLRDPHLAAPEWQVQPLHPLPLAELSEPLSVPVEAPALIRGYLRMGAQLLGPPAWDPQFNTADLPILLHIAALPARSRRLLGLG